MQIPNLRPSDQYDRSSPDIPRYRLIKHLAVILRANGAAAVIIGVVGLLSAALPAVSASLKDSAVAALASTRARHESERKTQLAGIEAQRQLLEQAHPDAHEMIGDRIIALRKDLQREDDQRAQEIEMLQEHVLSAASYKKRLWATLFVAWTWCHTMIVGGLISLGISQAITAFRDIAINSFLRLR